MDRTLNATVPFGVVATDVALQQRERGGDVDITLFDLRQTTVLSFELQQRLVNGSLRGEQAQRAVERHIDADILQFGQRQARGLAADDLVDSSGLSPMTARALRIHSTLRTPSTSRAFRLCPTPQRPSMAIERYPDKFKSKVEGKGRLLYTLCTNVER